MTAALIAVVVLLAVSCFVLANALHAAAEEVRCVRKQLDDGG